MAAGAGEGPRPFDQDNGVPGHKPDLPVGGIGGGNVLARMGKSKVAALMACVTGRRSMHAARRALGGASRVADERGSTRLTQEWAGSMQRAAGDVLVVRVTDAGFISTRGTRRSISSGGLRVYVGSDYPRYWRGPMPLEEQLALYAGRFQDQMAEQFGQPWPVAGAVPDVHVDDEEILVQYRDQDREVVLEFLRVSLSDLGF